MRLGNLNASATSLATSTMEETLSNNSGIANIPNQVHYLQSKKKTNVNLLMFGNSSLGKTSMINSILGDLVYSNQAAVSEASPSATTIRIRRQELEEKGIRTVLSLIDVPQLGQSLRKKDGYKQVLQYVKDQHAATLAEELKLRRNREYPPADTRVHACLYFVNPNSHKLSQLDLEILQELSQVANVLVVIGKADLLLRHELQRIRSNIREQLKMAGVELFNDGSSPNESSDLFVCLNGSDPSNPRVYPWGCAKVMAGSANGINELSSILFRSLLPELMDRTSQLYENYRTQQLIRAGISESTNESKSPAEILVQMGSKLEELALETATLAN